MQQRHTIPILYLITILIWGTTWLPIKWQSGANAVEYGIALRFLLSAIILLGYCRLKKITYRPSLRDTIFMILQGLFLFCFNYILIYNGTALVTSAFASITFSIIVIVNEINGSIFLKQRLNWRTLLGGVIGISGLCIAFYDQFSLRSGGASESAGILLVLSGTCVASFGMIISARNQRQGLTVTFVNSRSMLYGAIAALLFGILSGKPLTLVITPRYIWSLLYLSIFGSVIVFGTYLSLIGKIGPGKAAYAFVITPLIALIFSTLFESYRWSLNLTIGLIIIVCGNFMVLRHKGKRS